MIAKALLQMAKKTTAKKTTEKKDDIKDGGVCQKIRDKAEGY